MKYSKDGKVSFCEKTHSYFIGEKRLKSVTKYISEFKPKFDSELIASKYAEKHGLKKDYVLKMWKDKANMSCEMGTFIHSIFEDYILGNDVIIDEKYPKYKAALKFINDFFKSGRLIPIETEYIVYNNKLAGQVDCIAKNNKGDHFIFDWKTNEQIKFNNTWQKMIGKFNYLDDCNFNHYSIQLNKYKSMCNEYNIKSSYIVHLGLDDYEIIKVKNIKKP